MIAFSFNSSYYRRDIMKDLWVEDPLENPLWYHFVRAMKAGKRKRNNANTEVKGILKHPGIITITERFPREGAVDIVKVSTERNIASKVDNHHAGSNLFTRERLKGSY